MWIFQLPPNSETALLSIGSTDWRHTPNRWLRRLPGIAQEDSLKDAVIAMLRLHDIYQGRE